MPTTRRYREHEFVVHTYATAVQRQLASEWVKLNADPAMGAIMANWAAAAPVLAGLGRPGDVLDLIDRSPPQERDLVLWALIDRFHAGQSLAGRIVLQAMLPKLSAFAVRDGLGGGPRACVEERFQRVLADFWEVLCDFPVQRRRSRIAANLALDTLSRLTRRSGLAEVPLEPGDLDVMIGLAGQFSPGADSVYLAERIPTAPDPDGDLDAVLAWALDCGRLTHAEAELLREVYRAQPSGSGTVRDVSDAYATAAARTGVSPSAARQRSHRARARLAEAVAVFLRAEYASLQ